VDRKTDKLVAGALQQKHREMFVACFGLYQMAQMSEVARNRVAQLRCDYRASWFSWGA
jgi:hypothetical protein